MGGAALGAGALLAFVAGAGIGFGVRTWIILTAGGAQLLGGNDTIDSANQAALYIGGGTAAALLVLVAVVGALHEVAANTHQVTTQIRNDQATIWQLTREQRGDPVGPPAVTTPSD